VWSNAGQVFVSVVNTGTWAALPSKVSTITVTGNFEVPPGIVPQRSAGVLLLHSQVGGPCLGATASVATITRSYTEGEQIFQFTAREGEYVVCYCSVFSDCAEMSGWEVLGALDVAEGGSDPYGVQHSPFSLRLVHESYDDIVANPMAKARLGASVGQLMSRDLQLPSAALNFVGVQRGSVIVLYEIVPNFLYADEEQRIRCQQWDGEAKCLSLFDAVRHLWQGAVLNSSSWVRSSPYYVDPSYPAVYPSNLHSGVSSEPAVYQEEVLSWQYLVALSSSVLLCVFVTCRGCRRQVRCKRDEPIPTLPEIPPEIYVMKEAEEDCAICLSQLELGAPGAVRLPCMHVLHQECIHHWFLTRRACPLCRAPVHGGLARCTPVWVVEPNAEEETPVPEVTAEVVVSLDEDQDEPPPVVPPDPQDGPVAEQQPDPPEAAAVPEDRAPPALAASLIMLADAEPPPAMGSPRLVESDAVSGRSAEQAALGQSSRGPPQDPARTTVCRGATSLAGSDGSLGRPVQREGPRVLDGASTLRSSDQRSSAGSAVVEDSVSSSEGGQGLLAQMGSVVGGMDQDASLHGGYVHQGLVPVTSRTSEESSSETSVIHYSAFPAGECLS